MIQKTDDAHLVWKKWSTWLGIAAAGSAGALGVFAIAPERAQATVPDWALAVLMGIGMVCGFGVGIATSIRQQGLQK